ncbi:protein AF1q [Chanos chanos]|uniref:Protein AF1q n=1 Tax=Chanos chanos TaxID=29144 RepID=A0A6J2UUH8_CHACN|nr:protein AF1q [Chanos chanos]
MLDTASNQYDSFLFWRQPIPALDLSELEDLGLCESKPVKCTQHTKTQKSSPNHQEQKEEEMELSDFTTFNYWKEPIPRIDTLDFNLIL